MNKRLLAISVGLVVVIALTAVFLLSCEPTEQGNIEVKATLDGAPWTGAVQYTLTRTGESLNGTAVEQTFTVTPDTWTCAYVSGGPAGANFVDITPAPTQTLANDGTITFTLNFVTPVVPPLGATIEFVTWTINGEPVAPGVYQVPPDTIIDIEYTEHIEGPQGEVVTVFQTAWLQIHYVEGDEEMIFLHAVNADGAVFMDPPATKISQMTTVEGEDAPYCTEIPLLKCEPVKLDVEVEWELEICTQYTKTINWLHWAEANGAPVLFDILPLGIIPGTATFNLTSWAKIELEGDEGPIAVETEPCPTLTIIVQPPVGP
jgi:hypothetical protein